MRAFELLFEGSYSHALGSLLLHALPDEFALVGEFCVLAHALPHHRHGHLLNELGDLAI
jgi:hypothetical protein